MYIVMTGTAGDTAACRYARGRAEELRSRLSASFIQEAAEYEPVPEPVPEQAALSEPIGEAGVFAALWRLLEAAGLGADAALADIPVRQQTIEVCEILGANPYEEVSSGAVYLWDESLGLPPAGRVLGVTNTTNDRILRTRAGIRYLNRN